VGWHSTKTKSSNQEEDGHNCPGSVDGGLRMKTFGHLNLVLGDKIWVNGGYNWHRFAIGFSIDRYGLSIDFAFFWIGIEW
jgi:hypothetical protein